jgi:hypothetical protein
MSVVATETPPLSATPNASVPARWSGVDVALLVIVLLVAGWLRYTGTQRSLTYDELWHLGLSTGRGSPIGQIEADRLYLDPPRQTSLDGAPPFYQVWTHMDGVLHPPLYVLTLRMWRDVFGGSDAAAQSYSIVWSLVALGFVFATVRMATDRYAVPVIALAMAIAPTQIYFATAVRGYEMLLGLSAVAVWLMMRIERLGPTRRRTICLAAMSLPLLLTHYFALGAVAAIVAYGFWRAVDQRAVFTVTLAAVVAIYAIVWLPFAIRQIDDIGSGDAFLKVEHVNVFYESITLLAVPGRLIVDAPSATYFSCAGAAGAVLLVAGVILSLRGRPRAAIPLALWLICTIGFLAVLDVARSTRHSLYIRYFAVATPAAFALVAVLGRAVRQRFDIAAGVALLIVAIAVPKPAGGVMNDSPDYSMIARSLAHVSEPGEAVLIHGAIGPTDFGDGVFIHCSHEPGFFPRPIMKIVSPLSAEAIAALPRRAWLVVPKVATGDLSKMFPGARVLGSEEVPSQAMLFHLDLRPDATP